MMRRTYVCRMTPQLTTMTTGERDLVEHYFDQPRENRSTMGSVDLSRSDEQRSVPPSDEWRDLPDIAHLYDQCEYFIPG